MLRIIIRTIAVVSLAIVILFISLFFVLRRYEVRDENGIIRLEIPFLMDEPTD